jgi:hypothetical protein
MLDTTPAAYDDGSARGIGHEIHPGHTGNGACELCVGEGAQGLDIWMTPNTHVSSPAVGSLYQASVYLKLAKPPTSGDVESSAYVFFATTLSPDYPPQDRPNGDDPLTTDWQRADYGHAVAAGESVLFPGLHILLPPDTCVDLDDFTLTVGP